MVAEEEIPSPATAAGKAEKARGIPWDQGTGGAAQDRDCFQLKESAVCEQALAAKCGVQEMISGKEHKLSFWEECGDCSIVLIVPS